MPWDAEAPNLGFTTGTPWLPLGPQHMALAASEQESDPASPLNFVRAMMRARRTHLSLLSGDMTLLDAPLPLIAFRRGADIVCVFNLGPDEMRWTAPHGAEPGPAGTGRTAKEGDCLTLGPFSAWFGAL